MTKKDLVKYLQGIFPMSPKLRIHLLSILKTRKISKGDFLLKDGKTSRNVYFIFKGLVRAYYIKDGKEICSWFMKEGDVIFSVISFYTQTPGYEYIQALEDCEMFYITYEELQHIYTTFIEFNFIGRVLTERYYVLSEKRLRSIRMQPTKDRYQFLEENHKDLIGRVPNKYLATYLGVREETLSRRKKRSDSR